MKKKELFEINLFYMEIDHYWHPVGEEGTMVVGTILSGAIQVDDKVRIFGFEQLDAICIVIAKDRKFYSTATKGDKVALLLSGVPHWVLRNSFAISIKELEVGSKFEVHCDLLPDVKVGLDKKFRAMLVHGSMQCVAEFTVKTEDRVFEAVIETMYCVPFAEGDKFDIQKDEEMIGNCIVTKIL